MSRDKVKIHPTAEVADDAEVGKGTRIWHNVQVMRGAKVGRGCNIGKGVYIDFDVEIGDKTKVQNYVSIYHGVKIGSRVFLGPHCVFTNDFYPRAFIDDFDVTETVVEDGASIGANAVIVCGNHIGKFAMVGAGSVVTKNVPNFALVVGNPAKMVGYVGICGRKMRKIEGSKYHCDHCNRTIDVELDVDDETLGEYF